VAAGGDRRSFGAEYLRSAMGYECPVCATPQADRRHLADHLAVTAMTHGEDHADWLDEHVPDWSERSPRELGEAVAEHAPAAEYDRVFEDTVGTRGDHDHDHDHEAGADVEDALADAARGAGRGDRTDADHSVVEEARAMTRQMLDDGDADAGDGSEGEGDGDSATTAASEEAPDDGDGDE